MLVQKPEKLWETRPLDCWAQAKELRSRFYKDEQDAGKKHMFLIGGGDGPQQRLGPGFGNFHIVHPHPEAASIANAGDTYSRQCRAATEIHGYGRDICGYQLDYIGALLTNKHFSGEPMPKRDLVCQGNDMCAMFPKLGQLEAEFWDVPDHHADESAYYDDHDPERDAAQREYRVAQIMETIEWLEKAVGKKFDAESYIESIERNWRMMEYRGDVIESLCHVPSPLDQKSAYSLFTLGGLVGSDPKDTEIFWRNFRDEMRYRNEHNIAALATERYRWTENEPPPWFFLKYYRYMEEYGAICIQTFYQHVSLEEQPDGTFKRPKSPRENGVKLKTLEDAVRYGMMGPPSDEPRKGSAWGGHGPLPSVYYKNLMNTINAFKCDGAILTLHRAGIGCVFSMKAAAVKLMEAGIPVMHYETSHPGDRTDFDETRMLDQLDVFMETQGLRKLSV